MIIFNMVIQVHICAKTREARQKSLAILQRLYPDGGNIAIRAGYYYNSRDDIIEREPDFVFELWTDYRTFNPIRFFKIIRRLQVVNMQESVAIVINNIPYILFDEFDYSCMLGKLPK